MKPIQKILVTSFLFFCCVGYIMGTASASDCGCNAEPSGGWGAPDYTNDASWGSSFDDLSGGGGSSTDTGGSGSGSSGGVDDSSSSDSSGSSGSSGSDSSYSSSSDSGSSSSISSGSAEEGVVWRIKADDLARIGMYNESLAAYEKSITLDPFTIRSWLGKGKVLLSLERPTEAADAFSEVLRLDPGNTDALTLLGDSLNASGSYDEAVSSYTKALTMNPNLAGINEKIALSEAAKTMVSPINSSGEAQIEVAVVAKDALTGENETTPSVSSETPTVPATPKASFPGITAVLLAFGSVSLLLWARKQ
jgi:tetratricopeptide (TPR) repeat protein